MNKRQFVQGMITRLAPKLHEFDRALAYTEGLWDRLQAKGYGSPEPTGPRESVDWYAKLQGAAREQFDAFWEAYGLKKDRNGAAMRWYQLGDMTAAQAATIVNAAAADRKQWAETAQPGQVRKMAQGWLHEQRWHDYAAPVAAARRADGDAELRGLKHQLAGLRRLYESAPSDTLKGQIDALVHRIGNFQRAS
jgi:hypothetical protein